MEPDNITTTKNISTRIRPQKIAILTSNDISHMGILEIIGFLSRVWGGKYCPIYVVNKDDNFQLQNNLIACRPDIVLCYELDHNKWLKKTTLCCQPRGFNILNQSFIKRMYDVNPHRLILSESLVQKELYDFPDKKRDNMYLLDIINFHNTSPYFASSFGIVPDNETSKYAEALKTQIKKPEDSMSYYL